MSILTRKYAFLNLTHSYCLFQQCDHEQWPSLLLGPQHENSEKAVGQHDVSIYLQILIILSS